MTADSTSVIARGAGTWAKGASPEEALRIWLRTAKPNAPTTVDLRAVDGDAYVDDSGAIRATHAQELPPVVLSRDDIHALLAVEDMIFERVTAADEAFDRLQETAHAPAP